MRKVVVAVLSLLVIGAVAPPAAAASRYVSIGQNCAKAGARSQTRKHVVTLCIRLAGDRRLKWHTATAYHPAAPMVVAPFVAQPVAPFAAPPAVAPVATPCTGAFPVVCHYDVAPGFYSVSVQLVGSTSISVETRRKVLAETGPNGVWQFDGTVSVRNPEGQPTGSEGFGSPGLSIAFSGAPTILNVRITPATPELSMFLVGDSTVADLEDVHLPKTGWGQVIPQFFGPAVAVANYGDSGESAASYLAKPELFNTLERQLAAGSLVLIQFGHNDTAESAEQYRGYLTQMVSRVRARGPNPVLVTSPVTRVFDGATLTPEALHINGGINYPAEMRRVATEQNVPLIDLTASSQAYLESVGPAGSASLFATDNIHPNQQGAEQFARLVVDGLRQQHLVPAASFR